MSAKDQPARIAPKERIESYNVVRYYVWDRVVRAGHWINFAAVATLIFTGFYIGGPFYRPPVDEPYGASFMATMKNLHFFAGVVFAMNGLFRLYWFVVGRTYRQWFDAHIWEADFWREVWWKLREYLSLLREMWKQVRFEPQEYIPVGEDKVVVPVRMIVIGRDEIETVAHNAQVVTLREGKVTHMKAFQSKVEALEAAGLSE